MFDQLFDCAQRYVLFVFEGLYDAASFSKKFWLNKSFVRVTGIPFFSDRNTHQSFKLLSRLELGRQFLDHVLANKLAVPFFGVQLYAFHLLVGSFLFELLYFLKPYLLSLSSTRFKRFLIDSDTCPFTPSLFYFLFRNLRTELFLDFFFFFLFELVFSFLSRSHKKRFQNLLLLRITICLRFYKCCFSCVEILQIRR